MNLRVKRSIFLSVAILGLTVAGGSLMGQSASAKTYAKIASNETLTIPVSSRNVNFTGTKALYTKVGTLRGARVVATRSTLRSLASSKDSRDNVRTYRVAVTNRGSVYYKVVTFDGQYRGWIYGGKSTGNFSGGVTKYATFNNQGLSALTTAQQNATYKITTPGTANNGKSVTYKAPSWTQYKVGRAITDSSPYANTNFKIDQVGTRTRENDQWVHIYDPNNSNSPAAGWILMSGLTQNQVIVNPDAKNLTINLIKPDGTTFKTIKWTTATAVAGQTVGTSQSNNAQWILNRNDQADIQTQINTQLSGSSYQIADNKLSASQIDNIARGTFGGQVNIQLTAVNTTVPSIINPQIAIDGNFREMEPLTGVDSEYGTAKVTFKLGDQSKEIQLSAGDVAAQKESDKDSLVYQLKHMDGTARKAAVEQINADFYNAAIKQYSSKGVVLDKFVGTKGSTYSAAELGTYLNDNLSTLTTPKYPSFDADGNVTYKTVTLHLLMGDIFGGTYGTPTGALYVCDAYKPEA